jgi:NAD-dependent DNA ligase
MPRGVGSSKLQPLLAIESRPERWTAAALKAARPAGLSEATIDAIVEAVPAYLAWLAETKLAASAATPPTQTTVAKASGGPSYVVVLTGFRDKALETALAAAGHTVADSVTKKTTHVVYPDGPAPTSTKITKAQDIGAAVMSVSAFRAAIL